MWGKRCKNGWWVIKLAIMDGGVYCKPTALCFTTNLSVLKNCPYRSFIAVGGPKLFSNLISCDSLCFSLQPDEELIRRVSVLTVSPLFHYSTLHGLKSWLGWCIQDYLNNKLLLRPVSKQSLVLTVSAGVFTHVPVPTVSAPAHRETDGRKLGSEFFPGIFLGIHFGDVFIHTFFKPVFHEDAFLLLRASVSPWVCVLAALYSLLW